MYIITYKVYKRVKGKIIPNPIKITQLALIIDILYTWNYMLFGKIFLLSLTAYNKNIFNTNLEKNLKKLSRPSMVIF